jgi:hypothetical protein
MLARSPEVRMEAARKAAETRRRNREAAQGRGAGLMCYEVQQAGLGHERGHRPLVLERDVRPALRRASG